MHVFVEAIAIAVIFVTVFIGPLWEADIRRWERKWRQEVEGRRMDALLTGEEANFYRRSGRSGNPGGNSHQRRLARRKMERAQKLGAV